MMRLRPLILSLLAVGCGSSKRDTTILVFGHNGYRVHQDVTLHAAGLPDAKLQILEDDRITPAVRPSFQRGLPDEACAAPRTDSLRVFCTDIGRNQLRSALVRLTDATGAELDLATLERPIADAVLVIPASASTPAVYGVSVDLTAEAGTYSGPLVQLLDARSRRLTWLRARDAAADSTAEIFLATTPKTAWQVVPREDGTGHDILMVACRPITSGRVTDVGFQIIYTRFSADTAGWHAYRRTDRGCWEDDEAFPLRSRFP